MTPTSLVTAKSSADSNRQTGALLSNHVPTLSSPTTFEAVPDDGMGNRISLICKQAMDMAIAGSLTLISLPLFLITAAAIKLTSRGPVFYVQERVGQSGRRVRFFKFRAMRHDSDDKAHRDFARNFIQGSADDRDQIHGGTNGSSSDNRASNPGTRQDHTNGYSRQTTNGHHTNGTNGHSRVYKMTADPRVTPVGRFLRRTSLDELPQIFNVLRGEMSMVGPRPPVPYEVEHYQEWHKRRLAAKPGITGLWQVSGRSSVPFDEMVLLDLYYIENRSTTMDLRIMARTLPAMVKGDGAY
jgi:lipopolysaccharide/colanic/teichoic acid biosynthesis glycosyltransferase